MSAEGAHRVLWAEWLLTLVVGRVLQQGGDAAVAVGVALARLLAAERVNAQQRRITILAKPR